MDTETNDAPQGFDAIFDKAWEETAQPEAPESEESPSTSPEIEVKGEEETQAQEQGEDTPQEAKTDAEPVVAPVFLGESAKAAFYKLDRAGQELFLDAFKGQQADYTRKTQELAAKAKDVDGILEVFNEHEADLVAMNVPKAEAINYMLRWNSLLNKDPVRGVMKLAETLGVDLRQVQSNTVQSPDRDPAQQSQLEQRLARLEQERVQTLQMQQDARLEQEIKSLAQEKDGTGNVVRPMFQELVPAISGLVAVLANSPENADKSELELIDLAYRQAYEPYKQLQKAEREKLIQKSKTANRASASISSGSNTGVRAQPRVKSTQDAVDRAFDDLGM